MRQPLFLFRRSAAFFLLVAGLCGAVTTPLFASRVYSADQMKRKLRDVPQSVSIQVPLLNGDPSTLELERFEVWAPDGKIVIHEEGGVVRELPPPARFYYKGHVAGHDDSSVFISMDANDRSDIEGIVLIGEKKLRFARGIRKSGRIDPSVERGNDPILITENDAVDELLDPAANWTCKVEGRGISRNPFSLTPKSESLNPKPDAGSVAGATYGLRIAVETDFELYTGLGSTSPNVTTYITTLVGSASTVYQRDVGTTLTLGNLSIYATASDPYSAATASAGLSELAIVWHNTPALFNSPRSAVVMVSGKITNSGVAWLGGPTGPLCTPAANDSPCGPTGAGCNDPSTANSYFGAYAWCGSAGSVTTTVPDPNATVNGTQYALPNNNNFWMLLEFNHELGHVVGAEHTQCTALTQAEKTLYSTTRSYVDECYNADGAGCFSGNPNYIGACPSGGPYCPAPVELGTLMSYCHNVISGGFRQSRFTFGKSGEPSFKMLGIFTTAIDGVTPSGTITAGSNITCSAGKTASVPTCGGCTYSWQITGGTITSATNIAAITFTPSAPTTTVTSTVTTASGCSITTFKAITTQCLPLAPPTNVVASATNATTVLLTWTAAAGASSYTIYRSADNITFNPVCGNPTPSCPTSSPFSDTNGTVANTAYMYKIKSVDSGANLSASFSNADLATTVIFTDSTLTPLSTKVKAVHFTELRTAINAVCALAANPSPCTTAFTDTTLTATSTKVKAVHLNELRAKLNAARSPLGLTALTYTDSPTVTALTTRIKAAHVTELRNGVQ